MRGSSDTGATSGVGVISISVVDASVDDGVGSGIDVSTPAPFSGCVPKSRLLSFF